MGEVSGPVSMAIATGRLHFSFCILALLAVLLYVFTNNPLGCVIVSAVNTGLDSFSSGIWVWRNDPNARRGKICFAFHLSTAIWLGFPAALLALGVIAVVENVIGRPIEVDVFIQTILSLFGAITISCIGGLLSAIAAAYFGVKVWAHPNFKRVLERELQNGGPTNAPTLNYGTFVLCTALAFPILIVGCVAAVNPAGPWVLPAAFLGGPLVAILLYAWFAVRIFASGPVDYFLGEDEAARAMAAVVHVDDA